MPALELEHRWPDLFEDVDDAQLKQLRGTLVSMLHEGWQPVRETVDLLVRHVQGHIGTEDAIALTREQLQRADRDARKGDETAD